MKRFQSSPSELALAVELSPTPKRSSARVSSNENCSTKAGLARPFSLDAFHPSHLSCLATILYSKYRAMTQDRRKIWHHRRLPNNGMVHPKREASPSPWLFTLLVFVTLVVGGCQSPLPPLPNPPGPRTAVRLSPGDVLKLSFAEESDLDQTQKIRRDGTISLPYLGQVMAAGKRVIDFQHELTRRYEQYLDNPEVVVMLENGIGTVIVSGFANKPGAVTFDRPMTVYQAIMEAGGVSDYGSASNIHLTRIINGVQRTETINLRPSIHGEPIYPTYVQDGDVIYISRSLF